MRINLTAFSTFAIILASTVSGEEDDTPLSFAFAGSAFLLPYYFGVMQKLIQLKLVDPATTKFGGISGGAITTMFTCAGYDPMFLFEHFQEQLSLCYMSPHVCEGRLNLLMKQTLYDELLSSKNVENCLSDRVRIGISKLDPHSKDFKSVTGFHVSEFESAADVEEALLSTSYISCFSGSSTYTTFRSMPVLDGGYASNYRDICPPNTRCIKIASYLVGDNVTDGNPDPNWVVIEPTKKNGPLNNWPRFEDNNWSLPTDCSYTFDNFSMPENPDIYPGRFNKLKYSKEQWQKLSMQVGAVADRLYMFEMGHLDTQSWYDQVYLGGKKSGNLRVSLRDRF